MRHKFWNDLREDLGVDVQRNVRLPGLEKIGVVDALVKSFGAKNGMVIVSDFEKISGSTNDIENAGYGFSVFEQSGPYDRNSAIEMLRDWTWTGESRPPDWYQG